MRCKICLHTTDFVFSGKIMGKYSIKYFRCPKCKFMQTEEPYWLKEAYAHAITCSDVGLLNRNIRLSKMTCLIILMLFSENCKNSQFFFSSKTHRKVIQKLRIERPYYHLKLNRLLTKDYATPKRFIDYGGGYGIYVRLMRDAGFNFYWYDPHCDNIFAKGFQADLGLRYGLLTAFEVFEHFPDPISEIEQMMKLSDNILFSTKLLPNHETPSVSDWEYYGVEHGQHVSLFCEETLQYIAQKYAKNYYYFHNKLQMLTEMEIDKKSFKYIMKNYNEFSEIRAIKKMTNPQ